jgi:hypothetical protein
LVAVGVAFGEASLPNLDCEDAPRRERRTLRMTTRQRGLLFHFTHLDNLESIVRDGLQCDSVAQAGRIRVEVGNHDIKLRAPVPSRTGRSRRRRR